MPTLAQLARLTSQPSRSFVPPAPGGGLPPAGGDLAFDVQEQSQENWCWAATAVSVSRFYWLASDWTQCRVACGALARTDCCNSVVPTECNQPWTLDDALAQTQNFVDRTGPVSFAQLTTEIDAGRVVAARTAWAGGGAHFLAIYGYSVLANEQWLSIDDPIYAKSRVRFADFQTKYEGSGSWTHTYRTKSYLPNMPFQTLRLADHVTSYLQRTLPLLDPQTAPASPTSPDAVTGAAGRALGFVHPMYTVRLDALATGRPEPTRSGVRVFEMEADQPRAMFDLDSEHMPQVRQMSITSPYLRHFTRRCRRRWGASHRNSRPNARPACSASRRSTSRRSGFTIYMAREMKSCLCVVSTGSRHTNQYLMAKQSTAYRKLRPSPLKRKIRKEPKGGALE